MMLMCVILLLGSTAMAQYPQPVAPPQIGTRCQPGQFACRDGSGCLSQAIRKCDGNRDCADGSDEGADNCPYWVLRSDWQNYPGCQSAEAWPCQNDFRCVRPTHVCDGRQDCRDGSDEQNCPRGSPSVNPRSPAPPAPQPQAGGGFGGGGGGSGGCSGTHRSMSRGFRTLLRALDNAR